MKICFFSKYPPIEGSISAKTYWLSKALGERRFEIHIVTNALEVEEEYKENIEWENAGDVMQYQPNNVFVHGINPKSCIPFFHIPRSTAYLERLVSRGIEIIEQYQCDLIDSYYILPYGLAGFIAKILTGKPQILRYAGSDIFKLFLNPELKTFFLAALRGADRIVISSAMINFFKQVSVNPQRLHLKKSFSPYPEAFNPGAEPFDLKKLGIDISKNTPVITYFGKYNKEFKGLYEIAQALNSIRENFFFVLVCNGRNIAEFETYLKNLKGLKNKYKIVGFLPPWHIPGIMKASACIIQLEKNFPVKIHRPSQIQEAMAVGKTCLISDDLYEKFKEEFKLEDQKNILVANPKDQNQLKEKLKLILAKPEILEKIGREAYNTVDWQKKFDIYIEGNIKLYESLGEEKLRDKIIRKLLKLKTEF